MAEQRRGMGRGLAAILAVSDREDEDEVEELRSLPVDLIVPNPDQPRRRFDEDALVSLSESIRERGVLQPVLVRPLASGKYELIAGERRWRAASLAGMATMPAIVRPHTDAATLELALIENMAREDLNPIEEARACEALTEELGLSREDVGRRVGRGRVAVSNLLRLLELPDEAVELIEEGRLSEGHGRALLTAAGNDERRRLARNAVDGRWSVRELEARARGERPVHRATRRRRRALHPDQEDAIVRINDSLESALGREVEVTATAEGYRAHLSFDSLEDALELAERLDGAVHPTSS
ncbi:MAG TPA: ParB/RepB/Spo0J family partition protein [Solirubrobacteraceae bacterium]|nr:ParB/RepB/Spo0J family partition protein [Solirubrobacteraceae bacterium]